MAGVLWVSPSQGHRVPRPPCPLPAEVSPHCPWVHRAHADIVQAPPLCTRQGILTHTTHIAHVMCGGWAPACVGACLGTGRAEGHPSNSSHQHKALLLLHPAHTHVLGGHAHTCTPPTSGLMPTPAPAQGHVPHSSSPGTCCAPTLMRTAVHSRPSFICTLMNTHTYTRARMCITHPHESLFSHPHQGHTDTGMDMGLHNCRPTPHQCHPPTRSPEHPPAPPAAHSLASPACTGVPRQSGASLSSGLGPCPGTYWPVTTLQ